MLPKTMITETEQDEAKNYLYLHDTVNNSFIKLDTIVFVETLKEACVIHLNNGNKHTVFKTLKTVNDLLPQHKFVIIPPTHIVNIAFINRYVTGKESYLVLHDGVQVAITGSQKKMFSLLIK
jgi:two-component system, LytTR family, response regulator